MHQGRHDTALSDRAVILVADRAALVEQAAKLGRTTKTALGVVTGPLTTFAGNSPLVPVVEFALRKAYAEKPDDFLRGQFETGLALNVPVAHYTPDEARKLFRFDVGHVAANGAVYVRHPIFPDRYVAPADFSRILAREREAAFRQLVAALGARELELVQANVKTKKGLFSAKVSIAEAAADVGIKASLDQDGSFKRQVYASFGRPHKLPTVPVDLEPWVAMDPDLRTMVRARTEANQLKIRINLEFKQNQSMGGQIAAKVADRGLEIGGSYEELTHSIWSFEVTFWDLADLRS